MTLLTAAEAATERHYTPQEIAEIWQVDPNTVRRLFRDRPGVLRIESRRVRRGARPYVSLRIPESTLRAFHADHSRAWGEVERSRGGVE